MKLSDFLSRLYGNCEGNQVETRALPSRKQAFHALGDWQGIEAWCEKHKGQNLYLSVATRNGGGTKEHIGQVPAVWCDLDFKDTPREEAEKRLREFPLRPSFVVNSGGGFHVYWVLKEPLGREDIKRVEAVLRQIQTYLGGDPAATDASRILRLPGTLNHKYKPPRPVTVHTSNDFAYLLDDLADDLPGAPRNSEHSSASTLLNECVHIRGIEGAHEATKNHTPHEADTSHKKPQEATNRTLIFPPATTTTRFFRSLFISQQAECLPITC